MNRTIALLLCCLALTGCATLPYVEGKDVTVVRVRDTKTMSDSVVESPRAISNLVQLLSVPRRSWHLRFNPPWALRFTDVTLCLSDGSSVTMGTAGNYIICGCYARKITDAERTELYRILYPQQPPAGDVLKAAPAG